MNGGRNIIVTNNQINQLISLLHDDYQIFDIHVFNNKFKYAIWFLLNTNLSQCKHLIKILSGKVDAAYDSRNKRVEVFLFNFNKYLKHDHYNEYTKQLFVFALYHELRHHYQDKFNRLGREDIERDANRFASRMCNKYHDQINNIMNIKSSWEFRL